MNLLSFLAAFVSITSAFASAADCKTMVSGVINDKVWTAAGSPYCVTADVQVSLLTIEPGVEVRFLSNYVFQVIGRLQARGASNAPIRFTSTNSAGWQGIVFEDSVPGSFLEHCIVENSKNSALRIMNSPPTGGAAPALTNCVLINNSSPEQGGAINATLASGDLVLVDCIIQNNTAPFFGGGIDATMKNGTFKMINCTVQSNIVNVATSTGRAAGFRGGGLHLRGDAVLLNSTIMDNICYGRAQFNVDCGQSYGGGILMGAGGAGKVIMRNCRVDRNSALVLGEGTGCETARGGGIYVRSGQLTMQNCIVATNTSASVLHSQGGGIFVEGGSSPEINNCTIIANNTQGIFGKANCINSILYFNNGNGLQIDGGTVSYSDVQGGAAGVGNISFGPNLRPETLELLGASPCIDAGNPALNYNDSCIPPALGGERNDMGAYGGPAACCWVKPCGAPEITFQPANLTGCTNETATLCVFASGDEPLRYQWSFLGGNPTNTPALIPGATNACLSINSVQLADAGYYSVSVANAFGSVSSSAALFSVSPICVAIDLYVGLKLTGGTVGQSYQVQCVPIAGDTNWITITNITQTASGAFWFDPQPPNKPIKVYRVVP